MARFTVKRFPGYGWALMDNGQKVGDERGPWHPTRKHALQTAEKRNAALAAVGVPADQERNEQ